MEKRTMTVRRCIMGLFRYFYHTHTHTRTDRPSYQDMLLLRLLHLLLLLLLLLYGRFTIERLHGLPYRIYLKHVSNKRIVPYNLVRKEFVHNGNTGARRPCSSFDQNPPPPTKKCTFQSTMSAKPLLSSSLRPASICRNS